MDNIVQAVWKDVFKKTWTWFDGKKTIIGSALTGAVMLVDGIKPDLMNDKVYNGLLILFGVVFGTGLAHKAAKTDAGRKLLNMPKKPILMILVIFLASCAVQKEYNYLVIDHSNHLKQSGENVSKNDVLRIIDYLIIASDYEFEVKVSKSKTFENDTTKFDRKSILEPGDKIPANQNQYK